MGSGSTIRVVLADDSPIALKLVKKILEVDPTFKVVAVAKNGIEALRMVVQHHPDLLCTDLHMPKMDGFELTRRVMDEYPVPILVISVSVFKEKTANVFNVLDAGAVDVFPKPTGGFNVDAPEAMALRTKAHVVAGVHVVRRPYIPDEHKPHPAKEPHKINMLAIGASTGGPQAIRDLLVELPGDFSVPVLCVQHISPGFLPSLVDWLDTSVSLKVSIAENRQRPQPGHVYFAPDGKHLLLDDNGDLLLTGKPSTGVHRPSVDLLFHSVANHCGPASSAVLLSGMGRDGADGMLAISAKGGITFAQDEVSSVVYGMPCEAVSLGAVRHQLPPRQIGLLLRRMMKNGWAVSESRVRM